ncbi:hypothetical protein AMTR_s00062p00176270 [Amborella trichopoda]|uniref:Uncharacterized protein n=1 Tax=Amborella trichopoda TaxID=13333 RepID=U5DE25_AMBTC|nr:hypothetical protein AMTR_s00062p00176270 [Amborella trichopoda]
MMPLDSVGSPNSAPHPLIPLLAPSPLTPYTNNSVPVLSGLCPLNFTGGASIISMTAIDCWAFFAPFLANVICCPQYQATLHVLIGYYSRDTGMLALDLKHANYCLSDVQQFLASQGANEDLQNICSIHPSNLTEGSCPVKDVNEFESLVDLSKLLAACKRVDSVKECCTQVCQNAINEAATKIALNDAQSFSLNKARIAPQHSSTIDGCRNIVLRWLASNLEPSVATKVLRALSNCNVNKVCPLVFPATTNISRDCGNTVNRRGSCCKTMENYISHLQKQSFVTNLQALNCAALLGRQLQKANISENVYNLCHISLKDFSVQVGSQESGCLLPSLPSDVTLDQTGVSFTCDLNDNIAAPWPSLSQVSTSSCNKSISIPALPAATSAQRVSHLSSDYMLANKRALLAVKKALFFVTGETNNSSDC